jgi:hypothetical protein
MSTESWYAVMVEGKPAAAFVEERDAHDHAGKLRSWPRDPAKRKAATVMKVEFGTVPGIHARASLTELVSILTTMREEMVSARMGFGKTAEEKKARVDYYTSQVKKQAGEIDDALDRAVEALKKDEEQKKP